MSAPPKFDSAKQSKPHTTKGTGAVGARTKGTGSSTANSSPAYTTFKGGKK